MSAEVMATAVAPEEVEFEASLRPTMLAEFERRHPEFRVNHLDKVCERVCHEQMTPAKATAKFCRRGLSRSLTLGPRVTW